MAEQTGAAVRDGATAVRPDGARPGTDPDLVAAATFQPHVKLFMLACAISTVLPFVFAFVPGGPLAWVAAVLIVAVFAGLLWAASRLPSVAHIHHYGGKLMALVALWAVVWMGVTLLILAVPTWNYLNPALLVVAALAFLTLAVGAFFLERDRVRRTRAMLAA